MRQPKTGSFRPEARRAGIARSASDEAIQGRAAHARSRLARNLGGFRFAELVDGRPVQPRDCIPGIICIGGAQR